MGYDRLPQSVLRQKYADVLPILLAALEEDAEDQPVARSTIGCIEPLMIAQDGSVWNQVQTKKVYQALMVMSVDGKPKVRRISMRSVRLNFESCVLNQFFTVSQACSRCN